MIATTPLSNDQIARYAPSVFAPSAHPDRSERYAYVPTGHVIDLFRSAGFQPVAARQSRTRRPGHVDYTTHEIRFATPRADNLPAVLNEMRIEIALRNAHNGTSAYAIGIAATRLVCLNGLRVPLGNALEPVRESHRGGGSRRSTDHRCHIRAII